MGGGQSSQPATTTQINKTELPAWVEAGSQENYQFAKDIAARPYEANPNQVRVGESPATQQGYDFFKSNVGDAGSKFDAAGNAAAGLLNFKPPTVSTTNVNSGSIAGTDLTPYMNKYTDAVETRALDALDRSRMQSIMGNADAASKAKAFGGSRAGIVDAVTNAESARAAGDLSANLRKAGWDSATSLANTDISRELGAATANRDAQLDVQKTNQAATIAGGNLVNTAANTAGDLAQKGQAANQVDYAGLLDMGNRQRAESQGAADFDAAKWADEYNYPLEQLNIRLASLGMSPYGKTETMNKTSTSEQKGTDWSTVALGGLGLVGSLFGSDDEMKTDKQKMGKDPDSGLDIWAYRYKGDPKNYPKVVGVMASDVAKKVPGAVKRMPGKKGKRAVDYAKLPAAVGGWK